MAEDKKPDLNPSTMGGAARLLKDPDALDRAIEHGLGSPSKDPTYDATSVPLAPKKKD